MKNYCDIVEIQDKKRYFIKHLGNKKLLFLYNFSGNIKVWKKWQTKRFLV